MELNLTETRSRIAKTLAAESGNYNMTASAVIENDKITSISGTLTNNVEPSDTIEGIYFTGNRVGEKLKVSYNNISQADRDALDLINALVDAVVAKYEYCPQES